MSGLSYISGHWYCLVRTETVVLLPPDVGRAVVNKVWDALSSGSGVERVLTLLSGDFRGGLSAVPPFAVVSFTDGLHVLLRGAVQLTAGTGTSQTHVSGQGVSTWSERVLDSQESWTLNLSDTTSSTGEEQLPVVAGVVMAAAVRAGTGADAEVDPIPETVTGEASGADDDAGEETIYPGLFAATAEEPAEDPAEEPAEEPEAGENTSGYDHLWDQTVMRRVEDAAMRPEDEDEDDAEDEAEDAEPAGEPEPAITADAPAASVAPGVAAPVAGLSTGLIDSVPWARSPATPPQEPRPSHQLRKTGTGPASDLLGDHDGETVMKSDLPADQDSGESSGQSSEQKESRPTSGPTVLARLCSQGHANAPTVSLCSVCGQPVSGDTNQVRRPSLGRMRLSTGDVYELESSLIVGRQPSVSRVQGSVMPRLVQVTSESGDISRSHVEVRLEGWHVMLCDLRATNGTVLIRSGQPPRRLGEGEMAILLDGDIAQLGQDVSLRFEDLR